MSRFPMLQPVADSFRGRQLKPTVILLTAPLLLATWRYFCYQDRWDDPATGAVCSFLGCFVLMGLVPALIVKLVFRERLADYGVGLGIPGRTLRTFAFWGPVFVLAGYFASQDPAVLQQYPINPDAGGSPTAFGLHALTYLLYYLGWEFYFRGFMQFGLRETMGDANALLVQVLVSCLLHIGKPTGEIYGAILGGILWGMLAFRTRSLLSGTAQHLLLGLSLDWFICYG